MVGVVTILRWGRLYRKANPTPLHPRANDRAICSGPEKCHAYSVWSVLGHEKQRPEKKKTPALRPAAQDLRKVYYSSCLSGIASNQA